MDPQINMEERLWDYIDGLSPESEKYAVEALIETNLEWKHKYQELLGFFDLMKNMDMEAPSLRFSKNVMEEIAKHQIAPATRSYINNKIIWGIAGFFILTIIAFIAYALSQVKLSGANSPVILNEYNRTLNKIDWWKFSNNGYTNIFMLVNILLGLMMLDIYLSGKKEQHKESN